MILAWALRALDLLAEIVPASWLYRAARWLSIAALPIAERRRQTVRANQQRLHPEWQPAQLDAAVRRVFQENAMYYVDAALMPRLSAEAILHTRLDVEGLEHLEQAVAAGRGVILAAPHLSNPEAPFQAMRAAGIEAMALVEPLPRRQLAALQRRRARSGVAFVPATMEGVRRAIETLQGGGVVAILVDRDIQGRGTCVPFARRSARFPTGAADLALRTGAALVLGYAVRQRDFRFGVHFAPGPQDSPHSDNRTNDVRAGVADLMAALEPAIVAHSDQWRVFESPWTPCRDELPDSTPSGPRLRRR